MDRYADAVRDILSRHGHLSVSVQQLGPDDSLFDHGMSSFQAVQVMMAVEEAFGLQFPDDMIRKETFSSIGAIAGAVDFLMGDKPLAKRAV